MNIKTYRAFYLSPYMWIGSDPLLPYPPNGQSIQQIGEVVFIYSAGQFELQACRDGMFMLIAPSIVNPAPNAKIDVIVDFWSTYLRYINAFALLLDSAAQTLEQTHFINLREISRNETCNITFKEGLWISNSAGGFSAALAQSQYRFAPPAASDFFWLPRPVLQLDTIQAAVTQLDSAITKAGLLDVLASFAKSITEYKLGNYDTSLVLSWFIAEGILRQLWERTLSEIRVAHEGDPPRINAKRMEALLEGVDYTSAVISNSLELLGIVESSLFRDIDSVRRMRNRIAHVDRRYKATAEDAQKAISTANALTRQFFDFEFTPHFGFSVNL